MELRVVLSWFLVKFCVVSSYTYKHNDWLKLSWYNNCTVPKEQQLQEIAAEEQCGTKDISDKKGIIQSPNYPRHYPNDINCKWLIKAPKKYTDIQLDFSKFILENTKWAKLCFKDYLDVFHFPKGKKESIGKYCGRQSGKSIQLIGNRAEIVFKTNAYRTRKGFRIQWKAIQGCGGTQDGSSGEINLPTSPRKYYYCEWKLNGLSNDDQIMLNIDHLDFGTNKSNCRHQRLIIFNKLGQPVKRICKSGGPTTEILDGNVATVQLKLSRKNLQHAFKARWKSWRETELTEKDCGLPSSEHLHRDRRILDGVPNKDGNSPHRFRRILDEIPVTGGASPWTVQISSDVMGENYSLRTNTCGGVIISPWYILTAAHCVAPKSTVIQSSVMIGTVKKYITERKFIAIPSSNIFPHPKFRFAESGNPENDIALLRMPRKLEFNADVKPICLTHKGYQGASQEKCEYTRWQTMGNPGYNIPHLKSIRAKILGRCDNTASLLCVTYGNNRTGACEGDSGTPVVCKKSNGRKYLASILSYGETPCPSAIDSHVNVIYYFDWIKQMIQEPINVENNY